MSNSDFWEVEYVVSPPRRKQRKKMKTVVKACDKTDAQINAIRELQSQGFKVLEFVSIVGKGSEWRNIAHLRPGTYGRRPS